MYVYIRHEGLRTHITTSKHKSIVCMSYGISCIEFYIFIFHRKNAIAGNKNGEVGSDLYNFLPMHIAAALQAGYGTSAGDVSYTISHNHDDVIK